MQEIRVRSLVWEDPPCHRATEPECHNYWACALEPRQEPQLLKPTCPRACALKQKPLQWEACATQQKSSPYSPQPEKSLHGNKDPSQPKINITIKLYFKRELILTSWITVTKHKGTTSHAKIINSMDHRAFIKGFLTFPVIGMNEWERTAVKRFIWYYLARNW